MLVALYGATVGKTAILDIEASTNQAICAIFPDIEVLVPGYLQYQFMARRNELLGQRYGGAQPNISQTIIKNFKVVVPPIREQQNLAHTLRTIQEAIEVQERVISAARELKRSLMHRLFTYGPYEEECPTKETEVGQTPEHWKVVELSEVISDTQYGLSLRADYTGTYPMLRMNNLVDGRIDNSDLKYIELNETDFKKFKLNSHDIVFNRTNSFELVGKTALFDLEGTYVFASYLIRIVADESKLYPPYLNNYLNWSQTQQRLKMLATRGVSQSNISASKLRRFFIPLPPIKEQQKISGILENADRKICLEKSRKSALQQLLKSMLHQLMTGRIRVTGADFNI